MKFYIFGNNKEYFISSTKKALFKSDNLDEAVEKFNSFVDEIRNFNIFLLVDFEINKQSFISGLEKDLEGNLPFFIISEWHLGQNENNITIRSDHTIIKKNGFIHEFQNNLVAIRDFISCIERKIDCQFDIVYEKKSEIIDRENKTIFVRKRKFNRKIADSKSILEGKKVSPLKRIKLSSDNDWIFVPIENKVLSLFDLKTKNKETNLTVYAEAK